MILRAAVRADAAAVLELWSVGAENASRPPDSLEAVEALIGRDPEALQLAFIEDALVGTLVAGWDGWRCHLYRLAVHPDHRRRGVAAALLDGAEGRLAALGAIRIDAMVLDGNELGQSIWAARGYQRQPDWSRWVKAL